MVFISNKTISPTKSKIEVKQIVHILIGIIILKFTAITLKAYIKKAPIINLLTYFTISPIKNMLKDHIYVIIFRLSKAFSKVNESIYSISAPIGIPDAILVTLTSISFNMFLI